MRTFSILFGTFLLSASLMAAETPLIQVDKARIQSIALKAITSKYSELKSEDLTFDSILYSVQADGSEGLITVVYRLPASAKTESAGSAITTHTKSINVALSNAGRVMNVSKDEIISTRAR